MRSTCCCGNTRPPPRLCVFSTCTSVVGANTGRLAGLIAASKSSTVNRPSVPTSTICTPALAAAPPASCQAAWHSRLATTSSPGRVSTRRATWLLIVPLGIHSAASLPSSAAQRSCSRLVVGSSPYWSSPTGAAAIAARIASVGRVTVSERRSTGALLMARSAVVHWRACGARRGAKPSGRPRGAPRASRRAASRRRRRGGAAPRARHRPA